MSETKQLGQTDNAGQADQLGRPLRTLRLSVTDRCNLRCEYCMPEDEYAWLPRDDILDFEELERLVDVFTSAGVRRIRLTGGEPLLRPELTTLIRHIARRPLVEDLALTTNGVLLEDQAAALRAAGLRRLTVSLDTLRPDRFSALTRRDEHARVLAGLAAAAEIGFDELKIDSVILRGVNDDELVGLVEFGQRLGAEVRFIEYMDVAGATRWTPERLFSRAEMLARLGEHYGEIAKAPTEPSAPAERYRLPDGTVFGIIASATTPFCRACDRSRLSADGLWFLCLYGASGINLRELIRRDAPDDELRRVIETTWSRRADRGAEERLGVPDRRPLLSLETLRKDPHREMHTRGG